MNAFAQEFDKTNLSLFLFALAGQQKVTHIMFINNHVIYRDLIINDMQIRIEAPEEIKTYF